MADLCAPRDVLHAWIGIFHNQDRPDWARGMLDFAGELRAAGVRTYPQISPRTLDIHVNWNGGMSWFTLVEGWHRMVQAPAAEKPALLRSPQWRAVAREEWDRVPRTMIPHKHPERIRLVTVTRPENAKWIGSTLADLVAARGGHPSDVLADWLLENDLDPGIVGVGVSNADPDGVAETLVHPASVIANSDAGAHLTMMCAIGDTTLTLTRHVRDRGDMTVEQAVHRMTGQLADVFGFAGRGVLAEGNHGDVTIFALDELDWQDDVFVDDLAAGCVPAAPAARRLPADHRRRHGRPGGRQAHRGAARTSACGPAVRPDPLTPQLTELKVHDVVIRGGQVVDGSGSPRRTADVAIDGGRVVEIGKIADRGRREIDASGRVVAPGFVDVHTHLDVQGFWDPTLSARRRCTG